MNRRQRRAQARRQDASARAIVGLQRRVESTGRPGVLYGLTHACRDCHAEGEVVVLPGRKALGRIFHDPGCPAAAGTVPWAPVPL